MWSSSILRSLSLRIPMRLSASSSAVVPLPNRTSFDLHLTAEIDGKQKSSAVSDHSDEYTWLLNALSASISAQQITLDSLQNVVFEEPDRKIIDHYLDLNIRMLDTCNELTEKIGIIQKYVESLRVVSHLLEGNAEPHSTTLARVGDVLDSCKQMEKRGNKIGNCGSAGLRKIFSQKYDHSYSEAAGFRRDSRLGEILSGSTAVTSTVCAILGNALSFKTKHGVPLRQVQLSLNKYSWPCSGIAIMELAANGKGSSEFEGSNKTEKAK